MLGTLVLWDIPVASLANASTGEVATHNHYFGNEIGFNTVVKEFLKAAKGIRMIEPNIGQDEKRDIWKIFLDVERILGLQGNTSEIRR